MPDILSEEIDVIAPVADTEENAEIISVSKISCLIFFYLIFGNSTAPFVTNSITFACLKMSAMCLEQLLCMNRKWEHFCTLGLLLSKTYCAYEYKML